MQDDRCDNQFMLIVCARVGRWGEDMADELYHLGSAGRRQHRLSSLM